MQVIVDETQAGQRLDSVVAASLPRLSRSYARQLCDDDKVAVRGKARKAGYKLHTGDDIVIDYKPEELDAVPQLDLPVIYEDDDCVVINKPIGVLTHAQNELSSEGTVASFLRDKVSADLFGDQQSRTGRAGVVHRLDRATSGVLIGAKSQEALSWLQKQFSQRKVKKTYIAVVEGHLSQPEAIIDMPIQRNPKAPATFRTDPNGKPSSTHYVVLETSDKYSLLELKPQTGRTHQLRVHLQKVGHPIVGDPLYGNGKFGDRLYLHALSLEITLPSRERKTFTAPLPPEFKELLK